MKTFHVSRRTFLQRCTTVAALSGLPLWFVQRTLAAEATGTKAPSANDRPGIALIGAGSQGTRVAQNAAGWGEVVAVSVTESEGTRRRFAQG